MTTMETCNADVDHQRQEIRQAAVSHMVRAVASVPAEDSPFPHFTVLGLFPDDLYRDLLAFLPDEQLYDAFSYDKHTTDGASNRGHFKLTNQSIDRLLGRQRALWLGVRDALGSPEFKNAVFHKLSAGLAYRLGIAPDEAARVAGYPLPELFRETSGYAIKPHPDTRRKLITMQVALARDDSQRELGTEFYRRSFLSALSEPRGFKIVKRPPFLPNSAYAFTVINSLGLKSWHGRSKLVQASGARNSILNIWYARPEDANADLVAQYHQSARAA